MSSCGSLPVDDRITWQGDTPLIEQASEDLFNMPSLKEGVDPFKMIRPDAVVLACFVKDGTVLELTPGMKRIDSDVPIFVITNHVGIDLAVRANRPGVDRSPTKSVEVQALIGLIAKAVEKGRNCGSEAANRTPRALQSRDPFLGSSAAIRRLADEAFKIAASELPVLLCGETGAGKGVLAEWLHQNSPRCNFGFVDVNCAGLSSDLMESGLFGHERGAFTSASNSKVGLLETADGGSFFLDEIGDMDLAIQAKLLKVIEDKKFRRLGDVHYRSVDLRLICASHQDLPALVSEKKFRSDLYFRIGVAPLQVPPLRKRREDIPAFIEYFVGNLRRDLAKPNLEVSTSAKQALQNYDWPGNIRELRNVIERAAVLADDSTIRLEYLLLQGSGAERRKASIACGMTLEQAEAVHIMRALESTKGVVDRAAVILDIAKSTLYAKMKYYQIASAPDRKMDYAHSS